MNIKKLIIPVALSLSIISGVAYAANTSSTKGADLEWAFTQADQHPEKLLISVIDSSKTSLDIAIYSLTKPDIVNAIKNAKNRGVNVRIITDKIQSAGKTQSEALKILGSAGIPIKINKHSGLMHLKVTIVDNKIATTGSYNYSQAASTDNDEVFMVIRNANVAKSFENEFEHMWNDTQGFVSISPKIAQTGAATSPVTLPKLTTPKVTYKTCAEVKAAGKAPIRKGDPGYSTKLDRDGDGVACES